MRANAPPPRGRVPERGLVSLLVVGLVAATVATYWPVTGNGFVGYDDPRYITDNPVVQRGLTADGLGWAFRSGVGGNWHPLTWMTHMLDVELWGLWPGGHHLSNVILHALSAALLLLFFWTATGAVWASAFVAAGFALHPLHVESVAWAAERKDTLSTFFWITTMWSWWWYAQRPGVARYLLVAVSLACGLMSKAMLVTMPFVLLLLDWWPLGRFRPAPAPPPPAPARGARKTRQAPPRPSLGATVGRLVAEKVPLLVLVAVASAVAIAMQRGAGAMQSTDAIPLGLRLENAVVSYIAYVAKALWPSKLAVFYPYDRTLPATSVLGALAVLMAATAVAVRYARRLPWLPVGWLWYLGTLVPVIGLVQVGAQAMADRYTYVPLIGILIVAAWGVAEVATTTPARVAAAAAGGAAVVSWIALTALQIPRWRDSIALYRHAIAVTDGNYMMHYNLGTALQDQKRIDEAIEHYEAAARFNPGFAPPHNNLGVLFAERGRTAEAIAHYEQALRLQPRDAEAHNNLANALSNAGRLEDAVAHFTEATRLKPDYIGAYSNSALNLLRLGRYDEAATAARAAIRLNPRFPQARNMLGAALARQGKPREAIAEYREALRLSPGWPPAERRLAWLLATYPDPAIRNPTEALQLARHASERTGGKDPEMLDTLAAAAAAAGQFGEATAVAEQARARATATGRTALAADIEKRLAAYHAGQPYQE